MITRSVIKFSLMKSKWIRLFLVVLLLMPGSAALAQDNQPDGPVYIVQSGDTLWDISQRFGVSMDDLIQVNGIADPGSLKAGDQLVIPGLQGIRGILQTETVGFGETLRSLSRRYQVPEAFLVRLNHLTSPVELYAGANLIIPKQEDENLGKRVSAGSGQSLLEMAVLQGTDPWTVVRRNQLQGTWDALPGDVLVVPGDVSQGPGALPGMITDVEITPLPLIQGETTILKIQAQAGMTFGGTLMNHDLHFFSDNPGSFIALQGVHAMADPGLYPLTIRAVSGDGVQFGFTQMIFVQDGGYYVDPPLIVDPATIDPEVTKPEDAQWNALAAPVTPDKLWNGEFSLPVAQVFADCWPSLYGNRRSYNDGEYLYFHTGLDFCGSVGNEIYAPADGVVVFAGPLTVRGNATMIDHGWGVYTAYMHQSEILVQVGDQVSSGQLIGKVGATGRVTGPHLHWEVWAGGVQVNPMDWLERVFP